MAAAHHALVLPPGPTGEGQLCCCCGFHPIFLESWPTPGTLFPSEPRSEHSLSPESPGPWPVPVHINLDSLPGAALPGAGAAVGQLPLKPASQSEVPPLRVGAFSLAQTVTEQNWQQATCQTAGGPGETVALSRFMKLKEEMRGN